MYQAEALWINFRGDYPMAVKIAAGKVNAVTGEAWERGTQRRNRRTTWWCRVNRGWTGSAWRRDLIRQFVAMPLGEGYTAEEQLTGEAEHGGLQIAVYPMKRSKYEEIHRVPEGVLSDMAEPRATSRATSRYGVGAGRFDATGDI